MFEIFLWINLKILLVLMVYGYLMGRIRAYAYDRLWGRKKNYLIIDFFNLIGIPVHEMGHLLLGLLFGYHLDKICWYRTMKKARSHSGTLGFVKMHHKDKSGFQKIQGNLGQFFIGIGPLLFGSAFLYLFFHFLPDKISCLPGLFLSDLSRFFQTLASFQWSDVLLLLAFLYVAIGVSLNMELSKADLKLAYQGLLFLELVFLAFAAICHLMSYNPFPLIDYIFHYNMSLISMGILSGLFALLIACL